MGDKPSALDAAIAAFQKASREYREAKDCKERARREHLRAEERHLEAGQALQDAREQLNAAMEAETAEVAT